VAVTDGVERLGVLRTDTDTDVDDEQTPDVLRDLASTAALLMLSKRSFSDSYARLVRTGPMNVAAEMQWNLTPPPAYAGHGITVGAVVEPAYEVGGDAFDYAVSGSRREVPRTVDHRGPGRGGR
jgi:serine phosphatase RsbU (regulator of sigma subunit)